MNTKHTVGPWAVVGGNIRRVSPSGDTTEPVPLDNRANALLIATAPDLLATLCQLRDWLEDGDALTIEGVDDAHDTVVAAINKATGGMR